MAYLVNDDTKEYIDIGALSQDFNVYKNISYVMLTHGFRDIPSDRFPSAVVHKLVTSVVGRWKLNDKYYIAFNIGTIEWNSRCKYTDYTLSFIKALVTVSLLNYGITFTEPDLVYNNKVKDWFAYMNTEENKRKAKHPEDQTFKYACSLDDIWNPTYVIKDGKSTRKIPILKLTSLLHKTFNEPLPVETEQQVAIDVTALTSTEITSCRTAQHTQTMSVYIVNSALNEYVYVSCFTEDLDMYDFNMYEKILTVLQSIPPDNRIFPKNIAIQELVVSIVGRWKNTPKTQCSITYQVSPALTCITKLFIEAMISISWINYGFQFVDSHEDSTSRVDEWYAHMNPENRKHKASPDQNKITLPCSLSDIWKDSYQLEHRQNTKDLAITLFKSLQPISSDNFVTFMKDIS